jgi:signal peptidase I
VYTTGFVVTLLLSSVLKFPFVTGFLISQYALGLVDAVTLLVLTLLLSMLVRDRSSARSWLTFLALLLFALQFPSGFYRLATDRERMSDFANLWTGSWYLWAVIASAAVSMLWCIRRGSRLARMFNPPLKAEAPALSARLGEGIRVVVKTESGSAAIRRQLKRLEAAYLPVRRFNLLGFLGSALLVAVIASMLAVNAALLAFSYASPEKETSVMGYIPYVFQSTTMEPAVRFNDIAFFEKIDQYVKVAPGDIVLYKDEVGIVQVRKILDFYADEAGEARANADITHYVEGAQKDALKTTLPRSQIYGRLVGTNRSLGVVVLFANTMFGRLLFLLIPSVLIFFSGPIFGFLKQIGRAQGVDARRGGKAGR